MLIVNYLRTNGSTNDNERHITNGTRTRLTSRTGRTKTRRRHLNWTPKNPLWTKPPSLAALEAQLAAERARADELLEKSQRLSAEFQNARRRQEKQLADEIDRANAYLIKRLLPIVDDFDLAFANVPADLDAGAPWVEGFRQIQKKLHTLLEEENVVPIPPDGEFDPVLHDAIMSEPSESVPSGYLIATLRTGYTHKGRTLRPAMVRVARIDIPMTAIQAPGRQYDRIDETGIRPFDLDLGSAGGG